MAALLVCLTGGWTVLVGGLALPLVALVAATSPFALDLWNGHAASTASEPPRQMTDRELCRAWRATTSSMRRASSARQRLRLAQRRQGYLDELARRNPTAIRAWLESRGARQDGDPGRFL